MRASQFDWVIAEGNHGPITRLTSRSDGGWNTAWGGFISDEELAARWRILTSGARRKARDELGIKIDPPGPATKFVAWHEAAGRRLPDGRRIFAATRYENGTIDLTPETGPPFEHKADMVEVLA
jgi:hypothetical protein